MGHVGRLRVRAAVVFTTGETPAEIEQNVFRDPVGSLWDRYIAPMCGLPLERHAFRDVGTSTADMRADWLASVASTVARLFPAAASPA